MAAEAAFEQGSDGVRWESGMQRASPAGAPDYASRGPDDFAARHQRAGDVAVAARVGPVRLIDNHVLGVNWPLPPRS
jgi:pantothenate synthetase